MKREDEAVALFQQNFNCSQAVFVPFCANAGLSREQALKLSTVFGGGTCSTGSGLCGAANGALLALSLRHGASEPGATEAKARTYQLGQDFLSRFAAAMNGRSCEEILGVNVGSPEYKQDKERAQALRASRCVLAVRTAAQLLEESD